MWANMDFHRAVSKRTRSETLQHGNRRGGKTSLPHCQWTSTVWAKVSIKLKDESLQQLKGAGGSYRIIES